MTGGELILMRHCESEENLKSVFVGRNDSPLTSAGQQKAQAVKIKADICFCSTLKRATSTARLVFSGAEIVHETPALVERDWGEMTGLTYAQAVAKFGQNDVRRACKQQHMRARRGESDDDVLHRITKLLVKSVAPRLAVGQTVCIITHSRCLNAIGRALDIVVPRLGCGELRVYAASQCLDKV